MCDGSDENVAQSRVADYHYYVHIIWVEWIIILARARGLIQTRARARIRWLSVLSI